MLPCVVQTKGLSKPPFGDRLLETSGGEEQQARLIEEKKKKKSCTRCFSKGAAAATVYRQRVEQTAVPTVHFSKRAAATMKNNTDKDTKS